MIIRKTRGTLLVLALLGAAAGDAALAAGGSGLDVPFEKYTLPNGLEVMLHRDNSVPLVAVDLWYHVGSGDEMPGKSGFAHLFEHMMFQGTANTGEDRHFAALQEAGASDVNGSTNPNRTNYFEQLPSNQLEVALWLESERMAHLLPAITVKSLKNQRDVVRNERRQNYDNVAYGRDRFAVASSLYPEGHPYRHLTIGLHEDVEGGSLEDVRDFFRTWYVPANATLAVGGDFDPATVKKLIEKWFGSFPASVKPKHREIAMPTIESARRVEVHDSFAKLRRAHFVWMTPRGFAPGDAELDLLANVLAKEGTGRLYRRLVLDKPLAQSVSAFQASQNRSSEFHIRVDLRPDADLGEVERIVGEEVAAVRAKPVEAAELKSAVIAYESRFVHGLEPLLDRVETLQAYNHALGDPGRVAWDLERYRKATAGDVQKTAAQWLADKSRVEVVTLPVSAPQEDPAISFVPALGAQQASAQPQQIAFPDESFRAKQPAAGPDPALKMPPLVRFTLANGLDVLLIERHQLPIVRWTMEFPNGPTTDPAGKEGLAALCMDVLDDGTRTLDKLAFELAVADLGSVIHAGSGVGQDRLTFEADTLARNFDATLDLWSQALTDPGLRDADFERDRAQRLASLQQERSAAQSRARRLVGPVFYGTGHAFGREVTETTLGGLAPADCRTLVGSWLKPKGSRLFVTGDMTRATLERELNARLSGLTGEPAVRTELPVASPTPRRVYYSDVPGAAQTILYAGEPGPPRGAPDYPATLLAVDVLGGDFASRLNMNLREDKGYAYGASAFVRYYPMELSVLRAAASVRTDATKDALSEMVKELRHLAAGGITDDELRRNVNGEVLGLPARFATGEDALVALHEVVDFALPANYWETFGAALRGVTREKADAAAAAHIHPADLTYLVVGDASKVVPGLRELQAAGVLPGELVQLDSDGRVMPASQP